jgi:glutamate--cysteine ligase
MLDFVFEEGFGFERYVDYLLDVPMYFATATANTSICPASRSASSWTASSTNSPGTLPTLRDWSDHMTTAFPEVRLKKYLEMRGADSGPWNRICALPAFWVGLLYDDASLDAAWDLMKDYSREERHALRDGVPRHALKLPARLGKSQATVRELAIEALKISAAGLARRDRRNKSGVDERVFLDPLIESAEANQTPAERKLALYEGRGRATSTACSPSSSTRERQNTAACSGVSLHCHAAWNCLRVSAAACLFPHRVLRLRQADTAPSRSSGISAGRSRTPSPLRGRLACNSALPR